MIAQLPRNPDELLYGKPLIYEDVIDAQRRRDVAKGAAHSNTFFYKRILQAITDLIVGIRIRYIIKITTHNNGVRAFVNRSPHGICL